jgi:Cys-tRNA(Pro)/Cys-tRNA(Cys) deacylase
VARKRTTGGRTTGGTPATAALDRAGVAYVVRAYEHDPSAPSFGLEAAAALGVDPARVFKTLLVDTDRGLGVGVVPVDVLLDLKAVAAALGAKRATMADPAVAERTTGYVVGGISPVGQRKALPTVLDDSARQFATVLVSGGKRGLDIELAPEDLLAMTGGRTAAIARRA